MIGDKMEVVPLLPVHFEGFEIQDMQIGIEKIIDDDYKTLLCFGESYAGAINGKVVAMAGVVQLTESRWQAWALLGKDAKDHMIGVTKAIMKFLKDFDVPRLETPVRADFPEGHRWAKMLGFKCETPNGMKNYDDEGNTYKLYARVK